jgi:putative membrane protein
MSVIRTSLSLIGFGFTLNQVFRNLEEQHLVNSARAPRDFGETLVILGVGMVAVGIAFHVQFMLALRKQRVEMTDAGLIHGQSHFPVSYTLVFAILLLLLGVGAIASFEFGIGPLR